MTVAKRVGKRTHCGRINTPLSGDILTRAEPRRENGKVPSLEGHSHGDPLPGLASYGAALRMILEGDTIRRTNCAQRLETDRP